eukprot:3338656-Pleurochrysis_carterae.AAC.1
MQAFAPSNNYWRTPTTVQLSIARSMDIVVCEEHLYDKHSTFFARGRYSKGLLSLGHAVSTQRTAKVQLQRPVCIPTASYRHLSCIMQSYDALNPTYPNVMINDARAKTKELVKCAKCSVH